VNSESYAHLAWAAHGLLRIVHELIHLGTWAFTERQKVSHEPLNRAESGYTEASSGNAEGASSHLEEDLAQGSENTLRVPSRYSPARPRRSDENSDDSGVAVRSTASARDSRTRATRSFR
jgi:hypothetical protein